MLMHILLAVAFAINASIAIMKSKFRTQFSCEVATAGDICDIDVTFPANRPDRTHPYNGPLLCRSHQTENTNSKPNAQCPKIQALALKCVVMCPCVRAAQRYNMIFSLCSIVAVALHVSARYLYALALGVDHFATPSNIRSALANKQQRNID